MVARRRVLITGATGVVGREVLHQARQCPDLDVVAASFRGQADWGVHAWRMGFEPTPEALRNHYDIVINAAGRPKWNADPDSAHAGNVLSAAALEEVLKPSSHLVHISTAYATGTRGTVDSNELCDYRNTYEWSKAASEREVAHLDAAVTVVRPPLVIGRRSNGTIAKFTGMFTILRSAVAGQLPAIVADPQGLVETVPTDDLASWILAVSADLPLQRTELTIGRGDDAMSTDELVGLSFATLSEWRTWTKDSYPSTHHPCSLPTVGRDSFFPSRVHISQPDSFALSSCSLNSSPTCRWQNRFPWTRSSLIPALLLFSLFDSGLTPSQLQRHESLSPGVPVTNDPIFEDPGIWPATQRLISDDAVAHVAAQAASSDQAAAAPESSFDALRNAGYFGLPIPASFEGSGASLAECCSVQRRLGSADPGLAIGLNMHLFSVGVMVEHWRRAQDTSWMLLEAVAGQQRIVASAFAEPKLGGSLLRSRCVATRVPEGWRLRGIKVPCSLAARADLMCLQVEVDDPNESESLLVLLVPMTIEGVKVENTWDALGMRASQSDTVHLQDCVVPDDLVFHRCKPGFDMDDIFIAGVIWFCTTATATYLGVLSAALAEAANLLRSSQLSPGNHRRADLPSFQAMFGDGVASLLALDSACRGVADRLDAGADPAELVSFGNCPEAQSRRPSPRRN